MRLGPLMNDTPKFYLEVQPFNDELLEPLRLIRLTDPQNIAPSMRICRDLERRSLLEVSGNEVARLASSDPRFIREVNVFCDSGSGIEPIKIVIEGSDRPAGSHDFLGAIDPQAVADCFMKIMQPHTPSPKGDSGISYPSPKRARRS